MSAAVPPSIRHCWLPPVNLPYPGSATRQPPTTKAYGQLDFSGSYAIRPRLSLFLTATNLLRETIFKYQVYPNRPAYAEADGGTITLGIRGSL